MVNLDKWEKVTKEEIKIGDEIKRINSHTDGTRAVVTGVVDRYQGLTETFLSKDGFALLRDGYSHIETTELYRRKQPTQAELDAKFEFPTGVGAVIESDLSDGETRRHIYNGRVWHWTGTSNPTHRSEAELRRSNKNFKIISEGIK